MKIINLLLVCLFCIQFFACEKSVNGKPILKQTLDSVKSKSFKMKITIGTKTFQAILLDNPTTIAFRSLLPMTINMKELNNNEKYFDLPTTLPTNPTKIDSVQSGDLMLYGNNCLVLFYEDFTTSYMYTKIGRIENSSELKKALGSENAIVTFEKDEK